MHQGSDPGDVALADCPLYMGVKGCFIDVRLVDIEVIRQGVILNDIEPERAYFLTHTLACVFPNKHNERIYVLRLDGEPGQDTVHRNLLRCIEQKSL